MRDREVLRETREEVTKSGEVLRESRLVFFERSGGGREKQFLLLVLSRFCVVRLLLDLVLLLSVMPFCFSIPTVLFGCPLSLF